MQPLFVKLNATSYFFDSFSLIRVAFTLTAHLSALFQSQVTAHRPVGHGCCSGGKWGGRSPGTQI